MSEKLKKPLDYLALAVLEAEMLKGHHRKHVCIDMNEVKRAMDAMGLD